MKDHSVSVIFINHFNRPESDLAQHGFAAKSVRTKEIGRIIIQATAFVKNHRWPRDVHCVNERFDHREIPAHITNPPQIPKRVGRVVQDAGKNHNVKGPNPLRGDILNAKVLIFDVASEETTRGLKASLVSGLPAVPVCRQHSGRLASLTFERYRAIPRANVDHRFADETLR